MGGRERRVTYRGHARTGLRLTLAITAALAVMLAAWDDPARGPVAAGAVLMVVGYAILAFRRRLVLTTHELRLHGMFRTQRVPWSDLRRVDVGPFQPDTLEFGSFAIAHQLVLVTHAGESIEVTQCPGSRARIRQIQADIIRRGELLQRHSDPSMGGRHRPRPQLPRQGGPVPQERVPNR